MATRVIENSALIERPRLELATVLAAVTVYSRRHSPLILATGAQASCLHECEARTSDRVVELLSFDAAEAAALQAGMPAVQSIELRSIGAPVVYISTFSITPTQ